MSFQFECIGNSQTDDEIVIAGSLKEFGRLINAIEDERDRMVMTRRLSGISLRIWILKTIFFFFLYPQLERAKDQFIGPLENFRKEHIGGAKVREEKMTCAVRDD